MIANNMWRRGRAVLGIAVGLALILGISACGGGETTVTVTETIKVPAESKGKQRPADPEAGTTEGGAVTGYTDNVQVESDQMVLNGWAAAADMSRAATRVEAIVDGKVVAEAVPTLNRADVVEALGKPGLEESGFELRLPIASLDCEAPAAGIEVIGSLDKESSVLSFGEGIKEAVSDAC